MSAASNRDVADFVSLFQETWAECQALRTKEQIESSGHTANWEECLHSARIQARDIFEPAFSALERNAPLPCVLKEIRERLVASRNHSTALETCQLSQ